MDYSDFEKIKPIMANYYSESDRSRAILAGSLLDALLEQSLRKFMVENSLNELFLGYGPLSSFSAKIDVSHGFGLIGDIERDDLHRIRRIRNEFAHSLDHSLSFTESPIVDHIQQLKLTRTKLVKIKSKPDTDFDISVLVLIGFLQGNLEKIERIKSPKKLDEMFHRHTK